MESGLRVFLREGAEESIPLNLSVPRSGAGAEEAPGHHVTLALPTPRGQLFCGERDTLEPYCATLTSPREIPTKGLNLHLREPVC